MTVLSLRPSEIRYSQGTIARCFKNGRHSETPIGQTLDDLIEHKCTIHDIKKITVTSRDGIWYSGDNRRLWVFRKYEELGIIDRISAKEGYVHSQKFTTDNHGVSVRVRGDPGGQVWRNFKELIIKTTETSKAVDIRESKASTLQNNNSVVISLVEDDIQPSNHELCDFSEELKASVMIEPSLGKGYSEETGSCLERTSSYVEDVTTKGQENLVDAGNEDDRQHVCRTNDLPSTERMTFRSTHDSNCIVSNNNYVSANLSLLDGSPVSSHHSVDIQTIHLTVSRPGQSADRQKLTKLCLTRISEKCITPHCICFIFIASIVLMFLYFAILVFT
ncbi:uncharacterized protein LOC117315771 [Pecten maximus]|uniref:uncharacterized protein LOC117315771 n=1 Tax=Pecten maximus TaxID=6579 RepID=UPI0014583B23|nr:uncharacterized protein LOC117315771 [Pecten maximus]